MIRPFVNETSSRICDRTSQPACLTAGVMNLVQMSRSLRFFLFSKIIEVLLYVPFLRCDAKPLWSNEGSLSPNGHVYNQLGVRSCIHTFLFLAALPLLRKQARCT